MDNSTIDRLNKMQSSYARASQDYSKRIDDQAKSYKIADTTAHSSYINNPESEGYYPHNLSHNYDLSF